MKTTSEVYPGYLSIRNKPINLRSEHDSWFDAEFQKSIDPVKAYKIKNAIVFPNGRVFKNWRYFEESDIFPLQGKALWKEILKAQLSKKKRLSNQFIYYSFINSNWMGYFHWMTECLPKLFLVKDQLESLHILMPSGLTKFHADSLQPFEIKNSTQIGNNDVLFVPRLKTSTRLAGTGNYNRNVIHDFRKFYLDYFIPKKTEQRNRKIYISRKKASWRKIVNEIEVEEFLTKKGFEIILMENLELREQIKLMNETDLLISLHGAGLTNMLFMPEGSKVLELRHIDDKNRNCYFSLASEMKLPYYYLLCDAENPLDSPHVADHIVNMENLKRVVYEMDSN